MLGPAPATCTLIRGGSWGGMVGAKTCHAHISPCRCLLLNRTQLLPMGLVGSPNARGFFKEIPPRLSATAIRNSSVKTVATAVDADQLSSSDPVDKRLDVKTKYYFLVANAKFMLDEEEHFKELLCERLRNYGERNKEQDFWLVVEPKFLNLFPDITRRLRRPAVALVSTNASWITFMKLRLDRVLSESFEAGNLDEALASNPADLVFQKPQNWVAPYPKYEFGWWNPFLPPGSGKSEA